MKKVYFTPQIKLKEIGWDESIKLDPILQVQATTVQTDRGMTTIFPKVASSKKISKTLRFGNGETEDGETPYRHDS